MSTDVAHMLQKLNPGWVVVWGAWRRTYTAWAMWAPTSVSVEAPRPDGLTVAMRQAEAEHSQPAYGMFQQEP
jgi:hypothetical protein